MFEALAAHRALRGLDEHALEANYFGIGEAPGKLVGGGEEVSALGIRWWDMTYQGSREDLEEMRGRIGDLQVLRNWADPDFLVYRPDDPAFVVGPRRGVLDRIKKGLAADSYNKRRAALDAACWLEDPLTREGVVPLMKHPHNATRRRAIVAVGLLGCDELIGELDRIRGSGGVDGGCAVRSLALLGDSRSFDLFLPEILKGKITRSLEKSFPALGDANGLAHAIAGRPSAMRLSKFRSLVGALGDPSAIDVLLAAAALSGNDATIQEIFKPFQMTEERLVLRRKWNRDLRTRGRGSVDGWYAVIRGKADEWKYAAHRWNDVSSRIRENEPFVLYGEDDDTWTEAIRRRTQAVVQADSAPDDLRQATKKVIEFVFAAEGPEGKNRVIGYLPPVNDTDD
jgi:hypothetical protein